MEPSELSLLAALDALLLPLFDEQAYRFARPELEGLTAGSVRLTTGGGPRRMTLSSRLGQPAGNP